MSTPMLASRTTLRVGGPADAWVVARTEDDLRSAVLDAEAAGDEVLLLGGGSNLLVADGGFRGTVVEIATEGIRVERGSGGITVTVAAGEPWDDVVALTTAEGWAGVEALSGIPGRAGATPVQNVGAYGQEVAQVVSSVRVLDRANGRIHELEPLDCGFGYRVSRFKAEPDRWVVLAVTLALDPAGQGVVRYAELARALEVEVGDHVDVAAIRSAVLALRRRKGMVLDDDDPDTWSAGSFFTNPVVEREVADRVPPGCPRYPAAFGEKLSAAWLIEHAGVTRGFALTPDGRAAISGKHTLALTNRGGARADEVVSLARHIRDRVRQEFGILLVPEVRLVGCRL